MRLTNVLLALALVTACSQSAPFNSGAPVALACPAEQESRYFPSGSITGSRPDFDGDLFLRRWFSTNLALMEEPSLSCGSVEHDEAYRFLWLPSWNHPLSIRIFRSGDQYALEAVELSGSGGFEPGQISRRITKHLSQAQWQRFTAALDEQRFWTTTTTISDTLGNDGAEWIIEGQRSGRYHFVVRWGGADRVNAVKPLGELLLDFSELEVGHLY